jgi:hypothetical protein
MRDSWVPEEHPLPMIKAQNNKENFKKLEFPK